MTKRDAMRLVCHGAATLLDDGSENVWLTQDQSGKPYSKADAQRMQEAFEALCKELWKRGGEER